MHGGFGYGSRSQEGEDVLNFALAYDLLIANTVFKKRESHLVTFRSGQYSSQIDWVWLDLLSTFVLTPFLLFTEEDPDFIPDDAE